MKGMSSSASAFVVVIAAVSDVSIGFWLSLPPKFEAGMEGAGLFCPKATSFASNVCFPVVEAAPVVLEGLEKADTLRSYIFRMCLKFSCIPVKSVDVDDKREVTGF